MAFCVYDNNGNLFNLKNGDSPSSDETYYCPSCNCEMHYVSPSSNGRTAHFAGKHTRVCDIGHTSAADGRISDYEFNANSLTEFLAHLISKGVKKPSNSKKLIKKDVKSLNTSSTSSLKPPKTVRTVRQLFNILATADPNETIYDDVCVKNIYCGKSTSFLYTKYINGIHLIFAEFSGFSKKNPYVFLRYPSCENTQIVITVKIENDDDLDYYKATLENHQSKPVLLFGDINGKYISVDSRLQLVPLRKS